jgi:regulator of sirC expression with transglutaminase-like and TPR domain
VDVTARFAEVVGRPVDSVPLDEALLLIAAHHHPVDVVTQRRRLDELAAGCEPGSLASLRRVLFEEAGFRGDDGDYHHPDNSFLDRVVDRRRGLPILLSVLAAEVGRRAGVCLVPVGLPGHFLLRDCADEDLFVDPFAGGRVLHAADCAALFRRLHGGQPFRPELLEPVDARAVVARVLANLVRSFLDRGPVGSLAWAVHLRALVVGGDAWTMAARLRERTGDWASAAVAWDQLADAGLELPQARARAVAARARCN